MDIRNWVVAHPEVFPALFPLYVLAMWFVVTSLTSYLGGWSTLADRFRTELPFPASTWRGQSGSMRWRCNYGNCLTVGADSQGLFLRTMFLLRFRHPPLLIPWDEISVSRKRLWIFGEFVALTLGRERRIPLMIRATLARRIQEAAGERWPGESI